MDCFMWQKTVSTQERWSRASTCFRMIINDNKNVDKSQQVICNVSINPSVKPLQKEMKCKKMVSLENEGLSKDTIMSKFQEQQRALAERCKKNLSESIESMNNFSSLISH